VSTGAAAAAPALDVRAGPLAGREIPLGDQLLIGQSSPEPGSLGGDGALSRRHARIARGAGGVYFVQDTGSKTGTMLNGQPLRQAHAIQDGDEIRVGASTLVAHGMPAVPALGEALKARTPGAAKAPAITPRGAAHARLGARRLISIFAGIFLFAVVLCGVVGALVKPPGSRACPNGFVCHKPATAPALRSLATFRGASGWHLEYDSAQLAPSSASVADNSLSLHESAAQDGKWGLAAGTDLIGIELRAYPSRSESPPAAMKALAGSLSTHLIGATTAPSSDQMFASPTLGFHPGVGEVLEGSERTPQGPGGTIKLAVIAAESKGLTIATGVVYPVQRASGQQSNPDKPLDALADRVIETIRFPSDGPA
jgi:pSer/pThr/pTyr-binding forkhead associated (FHA) protein